MSECGAAVRNTGRPCIREAGHERRHLSAEGRALMRVKQQQIAGSRRLTNQLEVTRRRVGRYSVLIPADGSKPFIQVRGVDGETRAHRGRIQNCVVCGKEYFRRDNGRKGWDHCSKVCAKEKNKASKRATIMRRGPKKESLDVLFSQIIRSSGFCEACGRTERLQCAHVISRRYLGVRFVRENAMCLCAWCHMKYTYRPLEWEEFVKARMGAEAFEALKRRALDWQGPLDRREIYDELVKLADERGVTSRRGQTAGHHGWTGIYDPDASKKSAGNPGVLTRLEETA